MQLEWENNIAKLNSLIAKEWAPTLMNQALGFHPLNLYRPRYDQYSLLACTLVKHNFHLNVLYM